MDESEVRDHLLALTQEGQRLLLANDGADNVQLLFSLLGLPGLELEDTGADLVQRTVLIPALDFLHRRSPNQPYWMDDLPYSMAILDALVTGMSFGRAAALASAHD